MKRVLMVAYHFPPLAGSSGIQRTLRFVQHLPKFGWEPLVLTADPRAYERSSDDLMREIPAGIVVRRAFAFDTARHLSIAGRYIGAMARPDRWVSWKFAAIREGMWMIREFKPQAIWSTYPIATAHLIGAELQRRSGLPWIADFRDPMAQEGYPSDPLIWQSYKEIEGNALQHARYSTFTTPGAARMYQVRYPNTVNRIEVLENGYDEESFASLTIDRLHDGNEPSKPVTILHSGVVYPEERDPTQLFAALSRLKVGGKIKSGDLVIRFRAAVHDYLLVDLAKRYDVPEFIETCPPIPYKAALSEMVNSDALLVMQASSCNEQIPAKIYEYLRAGRPILTLTDPAGDTASVMQSAGMNDIVSLDSATEIEEGLMDFLDRIHYSAAALPNAETVKYASRERRASALAELLEASQVSS
jgi:hypothetical protein